MQTLKQQKLWALPVASGAYTLPRYETQSNAGITVVANAIRLVIKNTGDVMTERLLNSYVGKYLFVDDAAEAEVRLITSVDIVEGTPNFYYVIIESPFTITNFGDFDLNIVDPTDYEPVYGIFNESATAIYIDKVITPVVPRKFISFENSGPKAPVVVYADGAYTICNAPNIVTAPNA